jgi:hypothetical protein
MRRLPLILVVGLSVAAAGPALCSEPPKLAIAEVKTWEDLLKQPPLDLGGGVKVRLGVEATRCPRWAGVLLYAYTEGYDDRVVQRVNRDRLGPLWVSVRFGERSLDAKLKITFLPRAWQAGDKSPRLFCRPFMIDRAGEYQVTVRTEQGKEVAQVVVTGEDDSVKPFHPWSPLLLLEDARHERVGTEYKFRRTSPATATYRGQGIALPNLPSDLGFHRGGGAVRPRKEKPAEPEVPFGKGPLPKLLPEQVDPGLKLTVDAEKMLLRVTPTRPLTTYRPDEHFLARWWVNGKPFAPRQVDPIPTLGGGAVVYQDEDVLIKLQVQPRSWGAKQGDRVELQLLYCPTGWLPVRNPQTSEKAGRRGFPLLTNRVSFTIR